ncbi:MAG: hypothetical protein LBD47_05165 [Treponema sp.]|nr:hypothetical protein [Treponema sp.]
MLAGILASCSGVAGDRGETRASAIPLTLNTWAAGELATEGEQWFKFTATAGRQYIHILRGTAKQLYLQVYDPQGSEIGSPYVWNQEREYADLSLSKGGVYYLKTSSSTGGTYQIGFTESAEVSPDTAVVMASAPGLTADVWALNDLAAGEEQWFKFTATAGTQYIHVVYGTLRDLSVQVYDAMGNKLGDPYAFNRNGEYASLLVIRGEVYYLKVWPVSGSGSYKIAFNTSTAAPQD